MALARDWATDDHSGEWKEIYGHDRGDLPLGDRRDLRAGRPALAARARYRLPGPSRACRDEPERSSYRRRHRAADGCLRAGAGGLGGSRPEGRSMSPAARLDDG